MPRMRLALAASALCALTACSSGSSGDTRTTAVAPSPTLPSSSATSSAAPVTPPASSPGPRPGPRPGPLPLPGSTASADQVITVVAASHSSTTAELQAWTRVVGGWSRHGPSVTAHLGSGGVGKASEGSTRTPAGSFTLTQAFGHDSNPGTRLPYTRTTPDDWWISQSRSPLYNTRQRCASDCSFTRGDPNEHLYYETPFYDYAVVIDYNTANAPGGVQPGAGSAFFLHVTDGRPTAGCVSIPQQRLVSILQWLRPGRHPRILIGVN